MKNDTGSILLRICQHTCRLVAAVFRFGYLVHVKYLLHARRAGVIVVSCALVTCQCEQIKSKSGPWGKKVENHCVRFLDV